jgi:alpha-N-arabinofuranosidase
MNRAFQGSPPFPSSLQPWEAIGDTTISLNNASVPLSSALPTSLHVTPSSYGNQTLGFSNPGFWGIDVKPQTYQGSFYVQGKYDGVFTISLKSDLSDDVFATTSVVSKSADEVWTQQNFTLNPTVAAPNINNSLVLAFSQGGLGESDALDFNLISLFPPTYNNRCAPRPQM